MLEKERKYNEDSGRRLMHKNSILMDEMFNFIKNKQFFDHHIFNKNFLKYIFDTIYKAEVHYGDNPRASIGFLFKKKI